MDADFFFPPQRTPELLVRRPERFGFVARVDLDGSEPPIWRRLRLASDLSLAQVHEVLQLAMGWTDSHLHHFVAGPAEFDRQVQPFLTPFDVEEGEEGILEADVRLDQVLGGSGDRLFYEYDFGDGWSHTIRLEGVEPWRDGTPDALCLEGQRACPPEDVGGLPGLEELLDVLDGKTGGHDPEWVEQLLTWLPAGYDPSAFPVDEVNEQLSDGLLPSLDRWHPMVTQMLRRVGGSGQSDLGTLLKRVAAADVGELSHEARVAALQRYFALLRTVGDGISLTAAGYLPPRIVGSLFDELDLDDEWIGKGNREDQTLPVIELRQSATALGLVRKTRGKLTVTATGSKVATDPDALWRHITSRVPLGRPNERDAGMLALLFAAAGEDWYRASDDAEMIIADLGWQVRGGGLGRAAHAWAWPTLEVLHSLAGRRGDLLARTRVARALILG